MQRKILVIVIVLTGLCAWSPWLTRETASRLAESQFNRAWEDVVDGCGTSGDEYGVKGFRKVPFGAVVTLDYQCGLIMPGEPPLQTKIHVPFLGIAFGYPIP
jgi:hypothetical protein